MTYPPSTNRQPIHIDPETGRVIPPPRERVSPVAETVIVDSPACTAPETSASSPEAAVETEQAASPPLPAPPVYKVGYKRPPLGTRFKKGRSGNSKGRPKARHNIADLLGETFDETVSLMNGGRRQRMSKAEAMLRSLVNRALQNDRRAMRTLERLAGKLGSLQPSNNGRKPGDGIVVVPVKN